MDTSYILHTSLRTHTTPVDYADEVVKVVAKISVANGERWLNWALSICGPMLDTQLKSSLTFSETIEEIKNQITSIGDDYGQIQEKLIMPVLTSLLEVANLKEFMDKLHAANSSKVQLHLDNVPLHEQISKLNEYLIHYVSYNNTLINSMPITMMPHTLYNTLIMLLIIVSELPASSLATPETLFYHRAFSMMVDFLTDRFYTKLFLEERNDTANRIKTHILAENPSLRRITCESDLHHVQLNPSALLQDHYPNMLAIYMTPQQRIRFVYAAYYESLTSQKETQKCLIDPSLLWSNVLVPISKELVAAQTPGEYDIETLAKVIPQLVTFTGDPKQLQEELTNQLKQTL